MPLSYLQKTIVSHKVLRNLIESISGSIWNGFEVSFLQLSERDALQMALLLKNKELTPNELKWVDRFNNAEDLKDWLLAGTHSWGFEPQYAPLRELHRAQYFERITTAPNIGSNIRAVNQWKLIHEPTYRSGNMATFIRPRNLHTVLFKQHKTLGSAFVSKLAMIPFSPGLLTAISSFTLINPSSAAGWMGVSALTASISLVSKWMKNEPDRFPIRVRGVHPELALVKWQQASASHLFDLKVKAVQCLSELGHPLPENNHHKEIQEWIKVDPKLTAEAIKTHQLAITACTQKIKALSSKDLATQLLRQTELMQLENEKERHERDIKALKVKPAQKNAVVGSSVSKEEQEHLLNRHIETVASKLMNQMLSERKSVDQLRVETGKVSAEEMERRLQEEEERKMKALLEKQAAAALNPSTHHHFKKI